MIVKKYYSGGDKKNKLKRIEEELKNSNFIALLDICKLQIGKINQNKENK